MADLAGVTLHQGLGSYLEKAERMVRLVDAMAGELKLLSPADGQAARQAARLAKADLTTLMVPLTLRLGWATLHGSNLMDTPYTAPDGIRHWLDVAASTEPVAGVSRVGPVYTPPEHRRRGYGAAATAAVSRWAYGAGVDHVVLTADLANPTANSVYQGIGFRYVSDWSEYKWSAEEL